jgi:hypothetical protein
MKVSKLAPKTQARQNRFRLWGYGCEGKGGSRKSDRMSYRTSRDVNPQNRVESAIHSNRLLFATNALCESYPCSLVDSYLGGVRRGSGILRTIKQSFDPTWDFGVS